MKLSVLPFGATALTLCTLAIGLPASSQADRPQFGFPVACEPGRTCEIQHYVDLDPGPGTRDYRCGLQTYDGHKGVDIRLPDMAAQRRGVAVLAAAPGRVARLRDSMHDVSVRATGAPAVANSECGNGVVIEHGGGWETQYCHLARGSIVVKPGQAVAAGAPLGRIGLSGQTEFPHLHFQVRHEGRIVDPFRPAGGSACGAQAPLWKSESLARMPYSAGVVLNAGFADAQLSMTDLEAGGLRPPTPDSPVLIAYARAVALHPGDSVELALKGPDGKSLATSRRPPLERWRAQDMVYVGKRRPATGWPRGEYVAEYRVWRDGEAAIVKRWKMRL